MLTFIAARCKGVSPLWFLFMTVGLAWREWLPTGVRAGDLLPMEPGLSPCPSLDLWGLFPNINLPSDGGVVRRAGFPQPPVSLLLRGPGEIRGLFGVPSGGSHASDLGLFGVIWGEGTLSCLVGSVGSGSVLYDGWTGTWARTGGIPAASLRPCVTPSMLPLTKTGFSSWGTALPGVWDPAGLRKDTLLMDRLGFRSGLPACADTPTSVPISHCWLMVSSLCTFSFPLLCLRVIRTVATARFLCGPLLVGRFLVFLASSRVCGQEEPEPESWEEMKSKMERSVDSTLLVSGFWGVVSGLGALLGGPSSGEGFCTLQRTLRLRGLNQILKFCWCFRIFSYPGFACKGEGACSVNN